MNTRNERKRWSPQSKRETEPDLRTHETIFEHFMKATEEGALEL